MYVNNCTYNIQSIVVYIKVYCTSTMSSLYFLDEQVEMGVQNLFCCKNENKHKPMQNIMLKIFPVKVVLPDIDILVP